jgi:8-oxo-dGTP pyrophosphatase MutT (NUDIX family)
LELWDLYDRDGKVTGETWERKHGNYQIIPEGRYHMVCDILVRHVDGTYLLTKRDMSKDVYPGYWEASAGGSAVAGEDPVTCAKRELFEETGITAEEFQLVGHSFRDKSHSMFYSYLVTVDCPKDSIVLQEGETTEYRWVDVDGLLEYVDSELAIKTHNDRYAAYFAMLREKKGKTVTKVEKDGWIDRSAFEE